MASQTSASMGSSVPIGGYPCKCLALPRLGADECTGQLDSIEQVAGTTRTRCAGPISLFESGKELRIEFQSFRMPTESNYPPLDIPNIGIWDLLFERKDQDFPDDLGMDQPRRGELEVC